MVICFIFNLIFILTLHSEFKEIQLPFSTDPAVLNSHDRQIILTHAQEILDVKLNSHAQSRVNIFLLIKDLRPTNETLTTLLTST
jgi:hypothetical protein